MREQKERLSWRIRLLQKRLLPIILGIYPNYATEAAFADHIRDISELSEKNTGFSEISVEISHRYDSNGDYFRIRYFSLRIFVMSEIYKYVIGKGINIEFKKKFFHNDFILFSDAECDWIWVKNKPNKEKKMENIRITLKNETCRELEKMLGQAENKGDLRGAKRIMAIFALSEEVSYDVIALTLGVIRKTVMKWFGVFLSEGPSGLISQKSPGRRSETDQVPEKGTCRYYRKRTRCRRFSGCMLAESHDTISYL